MMGTEYDAEKNATSNSEFYTITSYSHPSQCISVHWDHGSALGCVRGTGMYERALR